MTHAALALAALLAGAPASSQEESPDPAALVAAAVEAHGGPALLARWNDMVTEGTGKLSVGPMEMEAEFTLRVRGGTMIRQDARMTFQGTPMTFAQASTGKTAWRQMRSRVFDHPPDDMNTWLGHRPDILLRAASAGGEALSVAAATEVDGDPVDVVLFEEDGSSTRILIDRGSRLVRGLEYRAVENAGMGEKEEVFLQKTFGDYREVDGVPFPHVRSEFREGVQVIRIELARVELGVEPELALFARPAEDEEAWEWPDQIAN